MAITDCPIRIPIPLDFEPPRLARQIMQEDAQLGRMLFSIDTSDSAQVPDGPLSNEPMKVNIVKSLQSRSEDSGEETNMTTTAFPSMQPAKIQGKREVASPMTEGTVSELSSIGSGLHHLGRCRPCQWVWSESGCVHGAQCSYCHFRHDSSIKETRPCKGKRAYYRKLIARIAEMRGQTLVDNKKPPRFDSMADCLPSPNMVPLPAMWRPPVAVPLGPPPGLGFESE
eukprot:CAMPEP_0115205998 /NCGR_PEP_ID=MMETSP0270-20121206/19976_1 /TAXON_ID=71861 /ORGANISM="Scrippsiella trochoidea, Strain CCMP3099" /LENGTH=226 /DNA_ID=CAMNT_0002619551 /DNA_START=77 /DNA_END=757 /DNA_ORIENTATION=+